MTNLREEFEKHFRSREAEKPSKEMCFQFFEMGHLLGRASAMQKTDEKPRQTILRKKEDVIK
jgi:hypothetical protein